MLTFGVWVFLLFFWRREILFWSIFFSIIHMLLSKFYITGWSYFEIVIIFLDIISNIQQSARVNSLSWCFYFCLISRYLVEYVGDFAVRIQDHRILETCPLYTRSSKYTFYNTRSRNSLSIVGITVIPDLLRPVLHIEDQSL